MNSAAFLSDTYSSETPGCLPCVGGLRDDIRARDGAVATGPTHIRRHVRRSLLGGRDNGSRPRVLPAPGLAPHATGRDAPERPPSGLDVVGSYNFINDVILIVLYIEGSVTSVFMR